MENKNLSDLINYAATHVEYYRELLNSLDIKAGDIKTVEDLQKLPLLTKSIVQGRHESFVSDEHQKFPKNENVIIKRTSGSTGKYLKIFWDYKDDIKSLIPLWILRNRYHSISPAMKFCSFYSVCYDGNKIINLVDKELVQGGRNLAFSKIGLTYERIKEIYKEILEFNPEWLMLQPSVAYLIAEVVKNENLPVPSSLKYFELSGEYLFNEYRKTIEETFGIKTVNMYGCNETNEIAYEYPDGKLHVISNNVIVEVIKDNKPVYDEEGDIYVTSLKNYAMPFIRYETGDRGILHNENKELILELKSGRASDFIILENGEKLNSYVFENILEYTNENMSTVIKQFQVIQTDINKFTVNLVIRSDYSGWKEAVEESFIQNVKEEKLKNAEWKFVWMDSICPNPETGKFKFFINNVK